MVNDINNQDTSQTTCCRPEKLAARLRQDTNRLEQLRKALWIVDNSKAFSSWQESGYNPKKL